MFTRDRISQLRASLTETDQQPEGIYFYFRYMIRLAVQVWHQLIAHKCLQQASALAFSTLICLVPLSAIALTLLKTQDEQSKFIVYINNFLPEYQATELVSQISELANKVGGLDGWRFLILLLISVPLFNSVERTFNDIWNTRSRLSFFQKYAIFYTILMIVPVLIVTVSVSVSSNWLLAKLLSWLSTYIIFLLMYNALPNTEVRWKPTLIGALIAGTFFHIVRIIFGYYLGNITGKNYSEIYGLLALIPILAIWVYIAWVITLAGAEITYAVQHLQRRRADGITEDLITTAVKKGNVVILNSNLAIRLFLTVAEHFYKGNGAYPKSQIMLKYGISQNVVDQIFRRFKEEELIYEVEGDTSGYLPARALGDITLDQVIYAFEGSMEGLNQYSDEFSESTEQLLDQLRAAPFEIAQNRSIEELLDPAELTKIYPA